ncbi:probable WRKY transcription factor 4 [Andrographis paniculata]|uniref:probable WRKY transcription factor 4 n=1 Tax=Andrographis paniculata TaxID=175694 RepID=UPI0021E914D5|nr:probable WRKY transcription factor 4 [Andrographis paniculata]
MGESVEDAAAAAKSKPTIVVPPRASMEFLTGSGPGFSPGPMTLVSNMFPENSPFSFSQLLAGAMASPLAAKQGFASAADLGKEGNRGDKPRDGGGGGGGHNLNRPMNLAVAPPPLQIDNLSSLFAAPPGLSPGFLNSPGFLSPLQSPFGMSHQQALAHVTAQAAFSQSFKQMRAEFQNSSTETPANHSSSSLAEHTQLQTTQLPNEPETSKIDSSEASQSEKKVSADKPAHDGYNWRKYGQKQVKASECPRSYYKCTHLNCPVKKKVERSVDGSISEITYKGQHNHDPPQPQKRGKDNNASDKVTNSQSRIENNGPAPACSEPTNFQATEHRVVASQNSDRKDTAVVVDGEEPTPKRRCRDTAPSIAAPSHQTVTESKIVLQTRSEVDLLDDGYKWRKYGQKVVKGNPYPRSYYRCTYQGCNVRKHVERASADPKAVITTYEGKHNHDIPVGRQSNSSASGSSQKTAPENNDGSTTTAATEFGMNKDQIQMTLQLKEEQIAA